MKQVLLLGYPLSHSVSPPMQNAAFRACSVRGVRYRAHPVPPGHLEEMIAAVRGPDCLGANVTIPYKQAILPYLDCLTDTARATGAVNTIFKQAGVLVGDNTDIEGVRAALNKHRLTVRGVEAVILGAGGAAAAVAFALAGDGAGEIFLLSRSPARSAALAARLREHFPNTDFRADEWSALPRAGLIVNATPLGMEPRTTESPLPEHVALAPGAVVFDLVYNPAETRFMREARARGLRAFGGLDMLIYQGARAFTLWSGKPAPIAAMRAAAQEALSARKGH